MNLPEPSDELQAQIQYRLVAQLYESEKRFRELVEGLREVVFRTDSDGRLIFLNEAWTDLLGHPRDDSLGRPLSDFVFPADPELMRKLIALAQAEGKLYREELCFRHLAGAPVWLELAARPDNEGGLSGSLVDVTGHKPADETFRRTSESLRAVLEASPLAIWSLDLEGKVMFWNPAAERMFGWKEEEVIGRLTPIVPEDQYEDLRDLLDRYKRGEMVAEWERRRRRKDGSPIDISFWTAPLRDETGAVRGHVGVVLDVTERKRLERESRERQNMEIVGRLAGGVAHDFNNLLTVINGYCRLLLQDLDPGDPLHEKIAEIGEAGERAAGLTRQLLAFSRKQILAPEPLNLNAVVEEIEKMLRRVIGEDIRLVTVLDPAVGQVMADPSQIHRVLMNLALNARDAMPDGGSLIIETAAVEMDASPPRRHPEIMPGSYVQLAVSDTGVGMSEDVRKHLFEPFFTTKALTQGTGLGLSTVYGIVKQSGGFIYVYSEPGGGTTFKLYFPRIAAAAGTQARPKAHPAESHGTETVLVVEDQQEVRKLACAILARYGYNVLSAASGREALRLVGDCSAPVHLLLTDVVMPAMSGRDLAGKIGELCPGVKTLFMSGYTANVVVHQGILDLNLAYIQKPFTPDALAAKVREVLGPPQGAESAEA